MSTLVGPGALRYNGLISWYADWSSQTTRHQFYHDALISNSWLYYLPEIDSDDRYIRATVTLPYGSARIPTPERALIDYLRHLDIFDTEYMFEGLRHYMRDHSDLSEIRRIASEYGASEGLEWWIREVLEDDCAD